MSRPRRVPPPPEAIAAARLTEFVRTHKVTTEDWLTASEHSPRWGTQNCPLCHEPWPCCGYLELARRLGWEGE